MWVLILHNSEDKVCAKDPKKLMEWVKEHFDGHFEFYLQPGIPALYYIRYKKKEIGIIVEVPEI